MLVGSPLPRSVVVWKMVLTCLFWYLWKEMNNRNFEDRERPIGDIISLFFEASYLWTAACVCFVD
jgi:hypothetical protein